MKSVFTIDSNLYWSIFVKEENIFHSFYLKKYFLYFPQTKWKMWPNEDLGRARPPRQMGSGPARPTGHW